MVRGSQQLAQSLPYGRKLHTLEQGKRQLKVAPAFKVHMSKGG